MRSDAVRRFAAELSRLERRVQSQEQWMSRPQMLYSSIDDGSIAEKNAAGEVVSRFGRQEDGTHGVVIYDGPVPPVPTTPEVEDGPRSITAIWGGTYANDVGKYDFRAVEFYAAPGPFSYLEEATLIGSIHDPDGGRVTVARPVGTWHVGALTLSAAGRRSGLSGLAVAESESIVSGEDLARLEGAFTTSDRPPTPEDGEDKPDGAYWTMLNAAGEQVARWRWVEDDEEWVETPLAVEFIPEAYVDFLAANRAFIAELESEIIHGDMFYGREFHGGLFSGTRLEGVEVAGAHIQGGELDIPGALQASPVDGVLVGGDLTLYEDLPARWIAAPPTPGVPLMEWATLPSLSAQDRNMIVRLRLERDQDYPFQSGRLQVQSRTPGVEHVQNLATNPRGRDDAAGWTGDVSYDPVRDAVLVPADPEVVLRDAIAEVTDGEVVFSSSEPSDTSVVWVDDSGTVREWVEVQPGLRNLIPNPRGRRDADGWTGDFGGVVGHDANRDAVTLRGDTDWPEALVNLASAPQEVTMVVQVIDITGTSPPVMLGLYRGDSEGVYRTVRPGSLMHSLRLGSSSQFTIELGNHDSGTIHFRAMVVEGEYDGPYFDGDMPGYEWEGEPHNSPSRSTNTGWHEITDPAVVSAAQAWANHTPITVPHQPVADDATLVVYDVGTGTTTRHHNVTAGTVPQTDTDQWVRVALMPGTYHGPYGDGDMQGWNWDGPPHNATSSRDGVSVVTGPTIPVHAQDTGNIRSVQINAPSGGWHEQVQVVFIRDEEDETPTGNLIVSDLSIMQPSPGDIEVSGKVEAQHGAFDTLEVNEINQGVMLLDTIPLTGHTGLSNDDNILYVPEHLVGTFRKFVINVRAGSDPTDSAGVRPLCIRINSDGDANYRAVATATNPDGSNRAYTSQTSSAFPRTCYIGRYDSDAEVTFTLGGTGARSYVSWRSTGWGNSGTGDGFTTAAGGRWNTSSAQQIEHFLIGTNTGSAEWISGSRAELWGYR